MVANGWLPAGWGQPMHGTRNEAKPRLPLSAAGPLGTGLSPKEAAEPRLAADRGW
jgi:hypothetical protein